MAKRAATFDAKAHNADIVARLQASDEAIKSGLTFDVDPRPGKPAKADKPEAVTVARKITPRGGARG